MEMEGTWLCPTELDRMRVVDANDRVRTIRHVSAASIGIALLAAVPWVGLWTLIPFALAAVNLWHIDRRIARSARPGRVSIVGTFVTASMLGAGVVLSGGPHSPLLPWMVLPAAMVAARFRPQVVIAGLAVTILLILAATFGAAPSQAIHHPAPVLATIALLSSCVSIVWALQAAELHHRGEAILDPLTGLLNRNALLSRFNELSQQAQLTDQPICLLLCDVDGFKQINDDFGHDRGDAVLRDIAYEMRKRLRSFELVYRLGGEEFLIVLPGVDITGGRQLGERLRLAIAEANPTGIRTTISLGVSAASGQRLSYESLFKQADDALYVAKRTGRNRVSVAERAAPIDPIQQPALPRVFAV